MVWAEPEELEMTSTLYRVRLPYVLTYYVFVE